MWERVKTINGNLSYKPTHTHTERSINCGMHELFYVFQISFNDSEQNETIIIYMLASEVLFKQ